ncbi:hypothetical protein DKX38_011768 [Salix brachista]|uniref:TF-B3 domain-containing protein n=1 Tax=Salix brachista TaxID=2182728 RepID=A0A5N5M031_9ROSI|nr:hypothetical protein DKX38_011768 [Salix brachista]
MGSILYSSGAPVLSGGNSQYSSISFEGSNFAANGHIFLSDVPENITLTPSLYTGKSISSGAGSFVGFDSKESKDRHVVPIGKLRNIKFMGIFRFKVWWVGSNGRDLEHETQMVMLDKSDDSGRPYVLLLPLLEGPFRASFQPGDDDNVDVCVESGSTQVCGAGFRSVVYMHGGDDPYNLMKVAMEVVRMHLGTFKLLEEKTPPCIVDKFGWCAWDAFYLTVHPQGIWEGVKGLVDGGCPPGLVLIDDGWQSISHDEDPITEEGMNAAVAGEQMPCRLLKFQENLKEEFTSVEIKLVKKKLTKSDIGSCLAYPTGKLAYPAGKLWAFQMVRGRKAINFNARDPTGRVWEFKLRTRNGPHKKPVIRGGWRAYVREKGLKVGDVIIVTMVEDAENGVSYNIRVEPNLELAI